uniref:Small ribosomal subunit protein uS17m n=1 Tax=Callorhinchus milii TaxID=7868 RepID=A0A4W3IQD5_CALMI|eukprot:gi/632979756/ref/XP_007906649.1/ PREDICTED: 28S ribosomal protein S17, mitochondrial [Callorhinchus milii]
MSARTATVHAKWIIGKVIGTKMQKTAKVQVTRLVLDNYLLKYFNKRKTYFAHDAQQQCTVGDIVLLRALPERRSKHVKHELAEIVFKVGNIIDPVTGIRCSGSKLLDLPGDCRPEVAAELNYLDPDVAQSDSKPKASAN